MKPIWLTSCAALFAVASVAHGEPPVADPAASVARTAEVRVRIVGIENDSGSVRVALFRGEEAYEANEPAARRQAKATVPAVEFVFTGLPPGRYSISSFHDRNANEKLDSNWVGLPTEPYGFSLNAMGRFGPPSFGDMAFELGDAGADLEIELH